MDIAVCLEKTAFHIHMSEVGLHLSQNTNFFCVFVQCSQMIANIKTIYKFYKVLKEGMLDVRKCEKRLSLAGIDEVRIASVGILGTPKIVVIHNFVCEFCK